MALLKNGVLLIFILRISRLPLPAPPTLGNGTILWFIFLPKGKHLVLTSDVLIVVPELQDALLRPAFTF